MSEQEQAIWLSELNAGKEPAFKVLFEKFYASLCGFAAKYVGGSEAAEDIVQDVFLKFYNENGVFETVPALKSYLYQMTRNNCLNQIRRRKIEHSYLSNTDFKEESDFFFNSIVEQELYDMLSDALALLPTQTAEVFKLVLQGYDNTQIAEKLNLSADSVKSHKKRGKQFLKKRLGFISAIISIFALC